MAKLKEPVHLILQRGKSTFAGTLGVLSCNGEHLCYTLEDPVREISGRPVSDWKIHGKTAIPEGTYKCIIDMSTRFKRLLPRLIGVPGFTGVRIHAGNTAEDTEGCVLVGLKAVHGGIGESQRALAKLMDLLPENFTLAVRSA